MKSIRIPVLLLICLLGLILALAFHGKGSHTARFTGSGTAAGIPAKSQTRTVSPFAEAPPQAVAEAVQAAAVEPVAAEPEEPADWVKRTISEEWVDGPGKLAGRQRVRIVEADFKYPRIRLEEAVTTDPQTGLEQVKLLRASVADHLMLGLRHGVDPREAVAALREMGYPVRAMETGSYLLAELPESDTAGAQAKALADIAALDEFIDYAEPDYLVFPSIAPNDPAYGQGKMWGLNNPGTSADSLPDADIDAPEGWNIRHDATDIVVAVTDTGIQYNHEDLSGNMWVSPTDGSHGFDAYDDDNDPMDTGGHGTHCAGTIGGTGNNAKGLTGVAWDVQLMGLRFLGPNGGTTSDAIRVVNYARLNGAHIISASWGGGGFSQSLFNAISACGDAGIPFVAAAGNDSLNNDSCPHYPSSYNLANIVAVASTTQKDVLSHFSCYGRTSVDIAAPGSGIWSTYIGSNTGYTFLNGTSMATPHVSGALALAMAQFPSEDMTTIIARLYESVDKIPALAGKVSTGGRLNLARLLGGSPPSGSNDDFADALIFEQDYGFWSGTSSQATREADENQFAVPDSGGIHSLWFGFHTPHAGLVSLNAFSNVSGYRMIVFEGSTKGSLKEVADSKFVIGTFYARLSFTSKPNTHYRVVLDDRRTGGQLYSLSYNLSPINDFFADATEVSGDFFSVTGTNRSATEESFEQNNPHAGTGRGKSIWWKWTAPADGDFTINTAGSGFDTVLAVYTGTNTGSLTEIASNDDRSALDWGSQVTFPAVAGTTYQIAVDSFRDDSAGEVTLNGFRSGMLNIIRQPASLSVELGKRAVFDVSVLSGGAVAYQWFLNDMAIPGQTSANLVIDPVRAEDFGNYKVEVSNSENLVTSETAILSEKQTPPKLVWSSGNQAVAAVTAVTLAATFSGSQPITYAWTKNGNPIPGDAPSLPFPSTQVADAGAFRLTATNTAGSATADFTLSVVASPWERWEWRRPGVTNPEITDIFVDGTRSYAVAGDALLHSDDGENWRRHAFPQGFTGRYLALKDGRFICFGRNLDNVMRVAVSTNAIDWTIHQLTGDTGFGSNHKLSVFKSHYIAADSRFTGQVYRSIDGIEWTRIQAPDYQNQIVDMTARGQPSTNGDVILIASSRTSGDGSIFFHRSNDGVNWQEHHVYPANMVNWSWSPAAIIYDSGVFKFFGNRVYTSADGFEWQYSSATSFTVYNDSYFARAGGNFYGFRPGSGLYDVITASGQHKGVTASPDTSYTFTAAATYGDKLIFGTNRGNLKLVSEISDMHFPTEPMSTLHSIEFIDNQFFAWVIGDSNVSNLYSGDGMNWKVSNNLETLSSVYIGKAYGKYWARTQSTMHDRLIGYHPFDARYDPDLFESALEYPSQILEAEDGTVLGVFSGKIHRRANAQSPWTAVSFPGTVSKIARFNGRWFTYTSTQTSTLLYTSTNGTTWTSTGITGSNAIFTQHQGVIYCFFQTGTQTAMRLRRSTNGGASWLSEQSTSGLPTSSQNVFAKRIFSFGGNLVMLPLPLFPGSPNQPINRIYYSNDGVTWIEGSIPVPVSDMAVGNGRIVGLTTTGGIIESGSSHPGLNAPQVSVISPQPSSTHLLNSNITVEGSLSDPEDGHASFDAFLDGDLVASGSGTSFRFPVTMRSLKGHTLTVHVRDSHGLKGMDSMRLKVVPHEPRNLLLSKEGASFIPSGLTAVLDGVFYAATARSLYRSLDGITWMHVSLPSFTNTIQAIAAGNGALVLQFTNGGVVTSRDGVNWTHFQPNQKDYFLADPLRFESGRFIATLRQISTESTVMVSENGLSWAVRSTRESNRLSNVVIDPAGTMVGIRLNPAIVERSTNHGHSWQTISAFPASGPLGTRGLYGNGNFVFIVPGSGKSLTSPDAYLWTDHDLPQGLGSSPSLILEGGMFFLGDSQNLLHASTDGTTWRPLSHPIKPSLLGYSRGLFLAAGSGGLLRSGNGLDWETVVAPLPVANIVKILSNTNLHLLIDSQGATWVSENDGDTWIQHLSGGAPPVTSTRIGREVVQLGDTLIAGGNLLVSSQDNGDSWNPVTLDGTAPPTNMEMVRMRANQQKVIGITSAFNSYKVVFTTDGSNFLTIPGLPNQPWADLFWNGSEWMLLARSGDLYRSLDNGGSWQAVAQAESLTSGGCITWFNQKWVIIGKDQATSSGLYDCFNLTSEGVFTKKQAMAYETSVFQQNFTTLVAHGRLMAWISGKPVFVTTDGTTWASSGIGINPSTVLDIYHTPEGFVAFNGSTNPLAVYSARSGPDGLVWSQFQTPFPTVTGFHNLGERLFSFAGGNISEIHLHDLSLSLSSLADTTLGVGDTLSPAITVRNHGVSPPEGRKWAVRAWLSQTRFFGDGKDTPIGTWEIDGTMPLAGESKVFIPTFTLPNDIPTGRSYLIFSLVSLDGMREANIPNNTVISDTAAINIPEWEFSVATNGNGQVNRDFAALRYPHKSQVSLTASAGKGASFTGWGGDALGAESQITVLMDGNKSVQANFSSRAALQVFVRGAGIVTGLPDLGSYPVGQTAAITATPAPGWEFSHWSGASAATTPSASILMNAPKTATAHFILPMAAWKNSHFNPAELADPNISGDDMDPDKDGVPSWKEYLHGSHPMDKDSTGAGPLTMEGGFLRCIYTRNLGAANGASVTCQAGRTLSDWNTPDLQERILSTTDGIETIEARIPTAGQSKGFFRFKHVRGNP